MRSILAICLLVLSGMAFGATKSPVIYNCNYASGIDVIDLACNIYFEAAGESVLGKHLVADTVLNRMADKHYPNTVSKVVYEKRWDKKRQKWVAMYSWSYDGAPDLVTNEQAWAESMLVAVQKIHTPNARPDMSFGAMWYHADYIEPPYWAKTYHRTVHVGHHIFYAKSSKAAERVMLAAFGVQRQGVVYARGA